MLLLHSCPPASVTTPTRIATCVAQSWESRSPSSLSPRSSPPATLSRNSQLRWKKIFSWEKNSPALQRMSWTTASTSGTFATYVRQISDGRVNEPIERGATAIHRGRLLVATHATVSEVPIAPNKVTAKEVLKLVKLAPTSGTGELAGDAAP